MPRKSMTKSVTDMKPQYGSRLPTNADARTLLNMLRYARQRQASAVDDHERARWQAAVADLHERYTTTKG